MSLRQLQMDFDKEQEPIIRRWRCFAKRPSITVIMVAVSFCFIIILCAFSFSGLGNKSQAAKRFYAHKVTFSTKTPYKYEENTDVVVEKPKRCRATQLNMVFRHGTRYPSENDIIKIDKMLGVLKRFQHNKEFVKALSKINVTLENPYKVNLEKDLAAVGDNELYNIGKRYQKRFPELLENNFRVNEFKFKSTCKARSSQSAYAFALGFLEGYGPIGNDKVQPVPIEINPCNNDSSLRYYDLCTKYQKRVEDNDTALIEETKFMSGKEVNGVVEKVKANLQLQKEENITSAEVRMMYLLCAFAIGILDQNIDNGWCKLFDGEDYDVMEYILDLKSYYKRSSAYKITYESSCPLLREILNSMKAKSEKSSELKLFRGIFRSSHAETVIPLYALMGLLVDKRHLLASNYNEMKNREFKGSRIAPFAGNLAIVLYECSNNTHKVQLYNNEKLMKLPCCHSSVDCPFEEFKRCYQKIATDCNLKSLCKVNSTATHDEL